MSRIIIKKLSTDPVHTAFDCGVAGINDMIINRSYYPTILQHLYSFEIIVDDVLVGYYMYGFRKLKMEECPGDIGEYYSDMSDVCYTLHIRYIAIATQYQHNGIGQRVLYLIIRQIYEMCKNWPIRLITLNALPERVNWYKENGFQLFNESDIKGGNKDIPMYMDCLLDVEKVREYCN